MIARLEESLIVPRWRLIVGIAALVVLVVSQL